MIKCWIYSFFKFWPSYVELVCCFMYFPLGRASNFWSSLLYIWPFGGKDWFSTNTVDEQISLQDIWNCYSHHCYYILVYLLLDRESSEMETNSSITLYTSADKIKMILQIGLDSAYPLHSLHRWNAFHACI